MSRFSHLNGSLAAGNWVPGMSDMRSRSDGLILGKAAWLSDGCCIGKLLSEI